MSEKRDEKPAKKSGGVPIYQPDDLEVDGQLISHNVWVQGHRTSVRLEAVMWQALHEIAAREEISIHQLITFISHRQGVHSSLTATIRAFLVAYFRAMYRSDGNMRLSAVDKEQDKAAKGQSH